MLATAQKKNRPNAAPLDLAVCVLRSGAATEGWKTRDQAIDATMATAICTREHVERLRRVKPDQFVVGKNVLVHRTSVLAATG